MKVATPHSLADGERSSRGMIASTAATRKSHSVWVSVSRASSDEPAAAIVAACCCGFGSSACAGAIPAATAVPAPSRKSRRATGVVSSVMAVPLMLRIEALGLVGGGRGRRRDELHERDRRLVARRLCVERGREYRDDLKLGWQRTYHLDARHRRKLGDLLRADLGGTACDQFADRTAGVLVFRLDVGGDAEL